MTDTVQRLRSIAGITCCQPAKRPPAEVLAWSEARLDDAAKSGPVIALWSGDRTAVAIGLAQDPEREADREALARDGVALVRRQSGGGAVLLYPGVLCWEAWAGEEAIRRLPGGDEAGIRQCYDALSRPVRAGLARLGVEASMNGICDLSVRMPGGGLRKVAGMAQLRRRGRVLVHGSLLVTADVGMLARYLRPPSDEPDYRKGRSHREFCVTVAEVLAWRRSARALHIRLAGAIVDEAMRSGWEAYTPPEELDPAARRVADGKYLSDDWNWRRIRP